MIPVILAVAVVCVSIYLYVRFNDVIGVDYWKAQGVPVLNPDEVFPKDKALSIFDQDRIAYKYFKSKGHKHYVSQAFNGLTYNPLDNDLVKHMLIKDFDYFKNRHSEHDEKTDPLNAHNLLNIKDDTWKYWRARLTPTFTSGKMKLMYPLVAKCAEPMISVLDSYAKSKKPLDIKELLCCFSTDVIATCAFGIDCNSIMNPDVDFRAYGREYMKEIARLDKQIPKYARLLPKSWQIWFSPNYAFLMENTRFFIDTVRKTIDYREKNNVVRNDFIQTLIQIKNQGTSDDDKLVTNEAKKRKVTLNQLAAQSFVFYLGGFETSATLMTFMCYELSTHQDIQDKVREDIWANIEKHGGLTYEAIQDMSYLNKVVNETLRLHPPVPQLARVCNREYTVPGTKVVLKKGSHMNVNISAFQRDPEYYPDPDNFNPENFDKEAVANRPMSAFMPFGEGPRNCIGLRFGNMQTRVGMATLLKDFRIRLNSKTQYPLAYDPLQFLANVNGGVYLDVERIK